MAGGWLDVEGVGEPRRVVLEGDRTVVGGADSAVVVPGAGPDRLHVWNEPPRVVFVGQGESPRIDGASFDERALRPGDEIRWHGVTLRYGGEAAAADRASLEEVALPVSAAAPAPVAPPAAAPWVRRLQAGLMVEQGLADRKAAKRWQDEVKAGRFDPDRCAQDILGASEVPDEMRLLERSPRLQRDLLMAPLQTGARGSARRARRAAKSGFAFLIAQAVGLFVYSAILLAIALFLRLRGTEFDALFDRLLLRD